MNKHDSIGDNHEKKQQPIKFNKLGTVLLRSCQRHHR